MNTKNILQGLVDAVASIFGVDRAMVNKLKSSQPQIWKSITKYATDISNQVSDLQDYKAQLRSAIMNESKFGIAIQKLKQQEKKVSDAISKTREASRKIDEAMTNFENSGLTDIPASTEALVNAQNPILQHENDVILQGG